MLPAQSRTAAIPVLSVFLIVAMLLLLLVLDGESESGYPTRFSHGLLHRILRLRLSVGRGEWGSCLCDEWALMLADPSAQTRARMSRTIASRSMRGSTRLAAHEGDQPFTHEVEDSEGT